MLEDDSRASLPILNTRDFYERKSATKFTLLYRDEVIEVSRSKEGGETTLKMNGPTPNQFNIKVCLL